VARSGSKSRPGRSLFALGVLIVALFAWIGGGVTWSDAQWTPKLALDLEGGTELILTPVPLAGQSTAKVSSTQLKEAVEIIRQRVNGSGVSEAEVTTQGSNNIVVSLPGKPDKKTTDLVKQSAQLNFRPVLFAAQAEPAPAPAATPTPGGTPKAGPTPKAGATPKAEAGDSSAPKATSAPAPKSNDSRVLPSALTRPVAGSGAQPSAAPSAAADPGTDPAADPATDPAAGAATGAGANDAAKGTASDLVQITPAVEKQFTQLSCADLNALKARPDDPKKPIVTCEQDGSVKYILGPVEVRGDQIKSASAGLGTNGQGFSTGQWEVQLNFTGSGSKAFATVTERLASLTGAQNQFAIVLDGLVVSAPTTNERIPTGQAQISGSFNQESATTLANQLKFGALPIEFTVQTEQQISALLGAEQLQRGLLAGVVGLLLVVLYSMAQYRALGLVTVFSLIIAGVITYGLVVLLGWANGFRLSLPGVAGLIVSIGITADSFIVYFERVRDEVREGRPLRTAVEAGWQRARRTIIISDAVNFLAASVLFVLAVGGVKGFAFTLGLTTLVDLLVVFLFTHPMVALLSRTHFFGDGHKLSGFSADQLGRAVPAYAGRGRVRPPVERETSGLSIAERRAAEQREREPEPGAPQEHRQTDVGAGSRRDG
jgi:preprotein translocase subunit SecD